MVGTAPQATVADAEAAAAAARDALPGWAATDPDARLALMAKAAAAIRAKAAELLPLVIAETGATAAVGSRMQVPVAADRFDRYSRDLRHVRLAGPSAPGGPDHPARPRRASSRPWPSGPRSASSPASPPTTSPW